MNDTERLAEIRATVQQFDYDDLDDYTWNGRDIEFLLAQISAAEQARNAAIRERDEYRSDYIRVHKDKCDCLDRESALRAQLAKYEAVGDRDAVMRALYCSDDYDLDQASCATGFDAILAQVRAGASHDGDCTQQSHTCFVCLIEQFGKRADAFMTALTPTPDRETNGNE